MILFEIVKSVNADVNRSTKYCSDVSLYLQEEFWAVADGAGDCEDYALAKRQRLMQQGHSVDDLHLATCWTETGEYHAVLVVNTELGEFVLDNRHEYPMRRELLPYQWHKIQDGAQWYAIV